MDVCNNVVNKIVNCVISSNQVTWFLNIKNLGGFINNIDKYYSENSYCMSCFTNNHNKKLLEW